MLKQRFERQGDARPGWIIALIPQAPPRARRPLYSLWV